MISLFFNTKFSKENNFNFIYFHSFLFQLRFLFIINI